MNSCGACKFALIASEKSILQPLRCGVIVALYHDKKKMMNSCRIGPILSTLVAHWVHVSLHTRKIHAFKRTHSSTVVTHDKRIVWLGEIWRSQVEWIYPLFCRVGIFLVTPEFLHRTSFLFWTHVADDLAIVKLGLLLHCVVIFFFPSNSFVFLRYFLFS